MTRGLPNRPLTLGYLGGERGGDGDKVEVLAAVVDRHLASLPQVICVGVALGHEGVQGEATVQQHAYRTTEPSTTHHPQYRTVRVYWSSYDIHPQHYRTVHVFLTFILPGKMTSFSSKAWP